MKVVDAPGKRAGRLRRTLAPCFVGIALAALVTSAGNAAEPAATALDAEQQASLSTARQLLASGASAQSIAEIQALLPTVQTQPYALALAQLVLAEAQQRVGDLRSAEQALRAAMAGTALPAPIRHDAQFQLARVLLAQGREGEALQLLDAWMNGEAQPSPAVRRMMALAYMRNGHCERAMPQLKALNDAGVALDAAWGDALRRCQGALKHRGSTTALVAQLLRDHPDDKRVWLQGVAMHKEAGQQQEALVLLELLAARGALDADELLELAHMYLAAGTPLRAARLLEQSLAEQRLPRARRNLELLAEAWRAGQEYQRAIDVYQGLVDEQADGNLYFIIGSLHFDLEHWQQAIDALRLALRQPVLKQVANAQLLLGIAACHRADRKLATEALNVARRAPETQAVAQWWLDELARREAVSPAG